MDCFGPYDSPCTRSMPASLTSKFDRSSYKLYIRSLAVTGIDVIHRFGISSLRQPAAGGFILAADAPAASRSSG